MGRGVSLRRLALEEGHHLTAPRPTNVVLRNQQGDRRHVGTVACQGATCYFKCSGANASWLRHSSNALGLNTRLVRFLKEWNIKAVYINLGTRIVSTSVATMERLGTKHVHPRWGHTLNLPLDGGGWKEERSGMRLGYVPEHIEIVLDIADGWEDEPAAHIPTVEQKPRLAAQMTLL